MRRRGPGVAAIKNKNLAQVHMLDIHSVSTHEVNPESGQLRPISLTQVLAFQNAVSRGPVPDS